VAASGLRLDVREGTFAGEPVSGQVDVELADGVALRGVLALQSASLPALAGIAVGSRPEAQAGQWSTAPFAASLPAGLTADFDLTARDLDLGLESLVTETVMAVEVSAEALNIDLMEGQFAGGQMRGSLAAKIVDGAVDATLRASLEGAQLQALVWERGGLPVASARSTGR
jgi:hypothetical protein